MNNGSFKTTIHIRSLDTTVATLVTLSPLLHLLLFRIVITIVAIVLRTIIAMMIILMRILEPCSRYLTSQEIKVSYQPFN